MSTMSFDYRSRVLRKLRITRVVFGLALNVLAIIFWLRMDLWPPLLVRSFSVVNASSSVNASDAVCLSRYEQYKYRSHEFPLSPPLASALHGYSRMFTRCANDHQDPGCKYLVYYEGWEGLGNRLLSLTTAFTYALLTNRALLTVATRGHLGELLCEPFPNATWVLPVDFGQDLVWHRSVWMDAAIAAEFVNVTAVRLNLRHVEPAGVQTFFSSETQEGLRNVPWVIWESNQYYIPRFFMLPEYWTTLREWFPDASLVFTQLSRVLCLPNNEVWASIEQVQDAENVQVGIQVRHVSDNASFSEEVYDRIVRCARELVPSEGAKVLVTSLQSVYYEKMRERWEGPEFVMVSHEGTEQYSLEQARKAMVEIWLLSFCNKALATSGWSTFGYVAQALAGMRPHILNIRGGGELKETEVACSHGQSPEPCLHYPFTDAASNYSSPALSSPEHQLWVAQHIVTCQDEPRGLQLVSL